VVAGLTCILHAFSFSTLHFHFPPPDRIHHSIASLEIGESQDNLLSVVQYLTPPER
jgi:hypothetical protein